MGKLECLQKSLSYLLGLQSITLPRYLDKSIEVLKVTDKKELKNYIKDVEFGLSLTLRDDKNETFTYLPETQAKILDKLNHLMK